VDICEAAVSAVTSRTLSSPSGPAEPNSTKETLPKQKKAERRPFGPRRPSVAAVERLLPVTLKALREHSARPRAGRKKGPIRPALQSVSGWRRRQDTRSYGGAGLTPHVYILP